MGFHFVPFDKEKYGGDYSETQHHQTGALTRPINIPTKRENTDNLVLTLNSSRYAASLVANREVCSSALDLSVKLFSKMDISKIKANTIRMALKEQCFLSFLYAVEKQNHLPIEKVAHFAFELIPSLAANTGSKPSLSIKYNMDTLGVSSIIASMNMAKIFDVMLFLQRPDDNLNLLFGRTDADIEIPKFYGEAVIAPAVNFFRTRIYANVDDENLVSEDFDTDKHLAVAWKRFLVQYVRMASKVVTEIGNDIISKNVDAEYHPCKSYLEKIDTNDIQWEDLPFVKNYREALGVVEEKITDDMCIFNEHFDMLMGKCVCERTDELGSDKQMLSYVYRYKSDISASSKILVLTDHGKHSIDEAVAATTRLSVAMAQKCRLSHQKIEPDSADQIRRWACDALRRSPETFFGDYNLDSLPCVDYSARPPYEEEGPHELNRQLFSLCIWAFLHDVDVRETSRKALEVCARALESNKTLASIASLPSGRNVCQSLMQTMYPWAFKLIGSDVPVETINYAFSPSGRQAGSAKFVTAVNKAVMDSERNEPAPRGGQRM